MLPKRLETVLSLVESCDNVGDIGCDHGYLTKAMLEKGCRIVQAIDNKKGPLTAAQNCLKHFSLQHQTLLFSLSSGLSELDFAIDTVVICGMGGYLICDIIDDKIEKARKLKKLVLQPNNNVDKLRRFLSNNNFHITDEKIVEEKKKYYEIIVCQYQPNAALLSDEQCFFGPCLLVDKSLPFVRKWQEYLARLQTIDLSNLKSSHQAKINQQIRQIETVLSEELC